jgi:hypothetical protein
VETARIKPKARAKNDKTKTGIQLIIRINPLTDKAITVYSYVFTEPQPCFKKVLYGPWANVTFFI